MTRQINLYGHKTTLSLDHFLTQGYCRVTAEHGMAEIEAETYTPERNLEWMKAHILGGCEKCKMANRIKMSIVDFLQEEFPERFMEWMQGRLTDPKIAEAWVKYLEENDPPLLLWFLKHPKNFTGLGLFYADFGSGKPDLIKKLAKKLSQ